jgi:hypothetical protein
MESFDREIFARGRRDRDYPRDQYAGRGARLLPDHRVGLLGGSPTSAWRAFGKGERSSLGTSKDRKGSMIAPLLTRGWTVSSAVPP